jgi:hypothetical protein
MGVINLFTNYWDFQLQTILLSIEPDIDGHVVNNKGKIQVQRVLMLVSKLVFRIQFKVYA